MARMVKIERLGFRQMLRQAILKSISVKFYYLRGLFNADKLKKLSGKFGLKISSL